LGSALKTGGLETPNSAFTGKSAPAEDIVVKPQRSIDPAAPAA